ncbi:hypothetical protein [uncultured Vagococcus sp.]|uniref:hypothetical protein n=1 Tax=uncultured Vagococcus sp. TaxID=189676 RepID=UPI0028D187A4|nr:hypothetical protein [uncultured Vagococcus sp.]
MEKRSLKAMREEIDKQLVVEEVKATSPFAKLQALTENIEEMTESFSQGIDTIVTAADQGSEVKPRRLSDILANVEQSSDRLDDDLAKKFKN